MNGNPSEEPIMSIDLAPISVCWDITSRCNEKCAFCYRVLDKTDLSVEQHKIILGKLILAKVTKISFVGGEPLLVTHLPMLLETTHNAGIITSLVTNGILLKRKWNSIAKDIDWVTLPIDGSSENVQQEMTRRRNHLNRVISLVKMLKDQNKKIKINTVVGRGNIHDLPNIARLVMKLNVDRWKIFRFIPIRGYAMMNSENFIISDDEFQSAVNSSISLITDRSKCLVTIADKEYLQNNYFSILPDGNVRVMANEHDIIVGSLLEQSVSKIWQSPLFDHTKHASVRSWLRRA